MKLVTRQGKPGKMTADYGIPDIYKYYREQTGPASISRAKFGAFIRELNEEIVKEILAKPDRINLWCNMGSLSVKKYKQKFNKKKLRVDWARTKAVGKRMYHLNEHRDGYRYFFHWEKVAGVPNISAYNFFPSRGCWRELGKILLTDPSKDYMERIFTPGGGKFKPEWQKKDITKD